MRWLFGGGIFMIWNETTLFDMLNDFLKFLGMSSQVLILKNLNFQFFEMVNDIKGWGIGRNIRGCGNLVMNVLRFYKKWFFKGIWMRLTQGGGRIPSWSSLMIILNWPYGSGLLWSSFHCCFSWIHHLRI